MDFFRTFNWNGLNTITEAVSIEGNAQSNITEVVNIGDVNNDGFTDLLIGVNTNRYGLILGGDKRRGFQASMNPNSPGLVRCWLVTSDASGGPWLMRAHAIGDIDKDGCADFCIIGSDNMFGGGNCNKWKYIVFGRRNWPTGPYDIGVTSTTSPKDHIELHLFTGSSQLDGNYGRSGDVPWGIGDLDGDGADDMAILIPGSSFSNGHGYHDNSLQAWIFRGNSTRENIIFYPLDNQNVPTNSCDKIWQGCTGGWYSKIQGADLDGDGRKELLLAAYNIPYNAFPVYVWKPDRFRTLGATPALDTPKPPSQWPGPTYEPVGSTHVGEENALLSADAVIQLSGFGNQMLSTIGDLDSDGKQNLIWTDWQTENGWSGGEVVTATNFVTADLTGSIKTNTIQFSPKQKWIYRWTKVEGDGWRWGVYGLAFADDLNGDGVGDILIDDRFGDEGHGNGWTAGGVRFIAGSTSGWTISTRLTLPLILQGEHDGGDTANAGSGKNGDGLGSQIENIAGFGSLEQRRGFAVMARWWDPVGTNTANYGKLYLVSPFASVPGTIAILR